MPVYNRNNVYTFYLILISFVCVNSCNTSFDSRAKNDKYFFSIYGYLDASRDTQWVRVMPIRDSLFFSPKPIDAVVTLENVNSGKTVRTNDSLIAYAHGRYAHNFWTTMDLQPARTYRITARKSGAGNQFSSVETKLPEDYPTPLVKIANPGPGYYLPDVVFIDKVKRLADVSAIYFVKISKEDTIQIVLPHLQDSSRYIPTGYKILINPDNEEVQLNKLVGNKPIVKKQIFIASAGPDWHNFGRLDPNFVTSPKGVSNVRNGLGYIVGIVSKTIPYKSCYDDIMKLIPCPLEK